MDNHNHQQQDIRSGEDKNRSSSGKGPTYLDVDRGEEEFEHFTTRGRKKSMTGVYTYPINSTTNKKANELFKKMEDLSQENLNMEKQIIALIPKFEMMINEEKSLEDLAITKRENLWNVVEVMTRVISNRNKLIAKDKKKIKKLSEIVKEKCKKEEQWLLKTEDHQNQELDWKQKELDWKQKELDWKQKELEWEQIEFKWKQMEQLHSKKEEGWLQKEVEWRSLEDQFRLQHSEHQKKEKEWTQMESEKKEMESEMKQMESHWKQKELQWEQAKVLQYEKAEEYSKSQIVWSKKQEAWLQKDQAYQRSEVELTLKADGLLKSQQNLTERLNQLTIQLEYSSINLTQKMSELQKLQMKLEDEKKNSQDLMKNISDQKTKMQEYVKSQEDLKIKDKMAKQQMQNYHLIQTEKLLEQINKQDQIICELKSEMRTERENSQKSSNLMLGKLKEKDQLIQSLNTQLIELQAQHSILISSNAGRGQSHEQELNSKSKEISNLKESIFSLSSQISHLSEQIQIIQKRKNILESENQKLISKNTELELKLTKPLSIQELTQLISAIFKVNLAFTQSQLKDQSDSKKVSEFNEFIEFLKDQIHLYEPIQQKLHQTNLQMQFQELMEKIQEIDHHSESILLPISLNESQIQDLSQSKKNKNIIEYFKQMKEINRYLMKNFEEKSVNFRGERSFLSEFIEKIQIKDKNYLKLKEIKENSLKFMYCYSSFLEMFFSQKNIDFWRSEIYSSVQEAFLSKTQPRILPLNLINERHLNSTLFSVQQTIKFYNQVRTQRFYPCNQYSLTVQQQTLTKNQSITQQSSTQRMSHEQQIEDNDPLEQFKSISLQLEQIKQEMNSHHLEYLNSLLTSSDVKYNERAVEELESLKENKVAQAMSKLLKQNAIIKKCLNQMMINEEQITAQKNEAFFQEYVASDNEKGSEGSEANGSMILDKLNESVAKDQKEVKKEECLIY